MKGWVLAIVCTMPSAVKLFVVNDYSTEGFMEGWARLTSDCGEPLSIYSDWFSQLAFAASGLDPSEELDNVDWDAVSSRTWPQWTFCQTLARPKA